MQKIFTEAIPTMLWTYALKTFTGKFNALKVDDDRTNPMEKFVGTTIDTTHKMTTHGAFQFMSWIQYYKAIYLDYPSGNLDHVQGYTLVIHNFMKYQ